MTRSTPVASVATVPRRRWTDTDKAEALRLLAEVGTAEASRRTGIPAGTIASWGNRNGVSGATATEAMIVATEHRVATIAERRAALAEELGSTSALALEHLARRVEAGGLSDGDLIKALSLLIDRTLLLTGEATERIESTLVSRRQMLDEARDRASHLRSVG